MALITGKSVVSVVKQEFNMKEKKYPNWICQECGSKASKGKQFDVSTWHEGKCDVCGETKEVTEPRDFFYPEFNN